MTGDELDYVLVGGGLQNGLIALALAAEQPEATFALVERDAELGGNHTWCFHAGDVPPALQPVVEPIIEHRWPGYSVAFPHLQRDVQAPYAAATSQSLAHAVRDTVSEAPGRKLVLGRAAVRVSAHEVELDDGTVLRGRVVIDARGPDTAVPDCAYQKFVGLEVELTRPHHLSQPWLMDATVAQTDGFRFFYVLPLSPTRLLVEDTYFADGPELAMDAVGAGIRTYAASRGYDVARVLREEHGVLPMPWTGEMSRPAASPLVAGYRGGWFHPGTGYSFPVALRLAAVVASEPAHHLFGDRLAQLVAEQRTQMRYCQRLNRMLFQWFEPADRWNVFERFYRLPEPLIRRFYSLTMTATDRARILIGRPPRGLSLRAGLARRRLA